MNLNEIRKKIDVIDDQLIELLRKRLDTVAEITVCKTEHGLPIDDDQRERTIRRRAAERLGETYAPYGEEFFTQLFTISRAYQRQCREKAQPVRVQQKENEELP